jgi:hypothetical protein
MIASTPLKLRSARSWRTHRADEQNSRLYHSV